jgi:hypothetical protein
LSISAISGGMVNLRDPPILTRVRFSVIGIGFTEWIYRFAIFIFPSIQWIYRSCSDGNRTTATVGKSPPDPGRLGRKSDST